MFLHKFFRKNHLFGDKYYINNIIILNNNNYITLWMFPIRIGYYFIDKYYINLTGCENVHIYSYNAG